MDSRATVKDVGSWLVGHNVPVNSLLKIELRLGIQRKMMKNDVFGNNSFNSSNELLNYLFGVGCIYILDDRRKCLDASPVP